MLISVTTSQYGKLMHAFNGTFVHVLCLSCLAAAYMATASALQMLLFPINSVDIPEEIMTKHLTCIDWQ